MKNTHGGRSAADVHSSLKSALQALEKAQQCAVLWFGEMMDRKLFRELGYSSINQYAQMELGFSVTRTNDFIMLCRKLDKLPVVKEKLESGDLGYTAARVIAPIVDQTNEAGWVDFALNNSRRELEREVKRARQEAAVVASGQRLLVSPEQKPLVAEPKTRPAAVVPVRVSMDMSPAQFARYEKLREQIRKSGSAPADKVEALLAVMATYVAQKSPRGDNPVASKPPVQIHIHQCPDCAQATVPTSKGELVLSAAEHERARCDCQINRPGERNTSSIPPATRRAVLARYRHTCQRPGCGHTQFLEAHHVVPRSRGGTNAPENLICLCSACHKLVHDTGLRIESRVSAPLPFYEYRAVDCPPARHQAARTMAITRCAEYVFECS